MPERPTEQMVKAALIAFDINRWKSRETQMADAIAAALAVRESPPRVRHLKRGTVYEVIGEAEAQVAGPPNTPPGIAWSRQLTEGHKLTVYRGEDGRLWARFSDEFNDGRFVPVTVPKCLRDAKHDHGLQGPCSAGQCQWPDCREGGEHD
ncbi:hypothetical protein [uncultured Alsobacter sp.]|uniref:hypothetical protein n=1 Tax=uncultured Alsobacter sp. TaxID=1748258 RepID=UPI0025D6D256|nr:hypothetical protein [uncultured Alsobacter sp.]